MARNEPNPYSLRESLNLAIFQVPRPIHIADSFALPNESTHVLLRFSSRGAISIAVFVPDVTKPALNARQPGPVYLIKRVAVRAKVRRAWPEAGVGWSRTQVRAKERA